MHSLWHWRYALAGMILLLSSCILPSRAQEFTLKPAVAVEAENFTVESGWTVVKNGQGNYMVDIVGFQHISGERLLCVDEKNTTASAYKDITVPVDGAYRLWVRYEYPPFTEDRFQVIVQQNGQTVAQKLMGAKDNPRAVFGDYNFRPQYDPSWGSEGLAEEVLDVPGLQAGPARVYLKAVGQPQMPSVSAHRNIDFIYLTSDTADAWIRHYGVDLNIHTYPILEAFRDTVGARYEVQFTNNGAKPATYNVTHVYNRIPWGAYEGTVATDVAPGAKTAWIPMKKQDTTHFGATAFAIQGPYQPYSIAIRPVGGAVERTFDSTRYFAKTRNGILVYLPSYPGKGETPITPVDEIDAILKLIKNSPKVGRTPTLPLAYCMPTNIIPLSDDSIYGQKYADLYVAAGLRYIPQGLYGDATKNDDLLAIKQLKDRGVGINKSMWALTYRNPPTDENIAKWKKEFDGNGHGQYLKWYDYGDEISFSEWVGMAATDLAATNPVFKGMTQEQIIGALWKTWLTKNRPGYDPAVYKLQPDSTAAAAVANPRLYVDSLEFYEDTSIAFAAQGMKKVKATFGQDVLCGANYSGHPFYYPTIDMYVKWFRGGAADMGRHSDYFWEVGQPGPMVNGYFAEHFRAGMRDNPQAVVRQYNEPHSPGNTHASFLRSAFTHLVHGVKNLDFFGMGMNETFSENHIDHRDHQRYQDIHDITYSMGLVEDLLPKSTVVPSKVALLLSDSTERWDFAGIALEAGQHDVWSGNFRKMRMSFHQERLGIWYALTYAGAAPDLLIEEDINPARLKDYTVLYIVGDCLPANLTPVLAAWVKQGGIVMATAGAGQYDTYRQPNPDLRQLLGIASRKYEERTPFFRTRMELPFLQPLSTIKLNNLSMPQIATYERITPVTGAKTMAAFADDNSPAVIETTLGNGRIYYCAALPGVAYMWRALQPPMVPDRGPSAHTVPTNFDIGAAAILKMPLQAAKFTPIVTNNLGLIDTRLLKAPKGYILPMANYNTRVGQKVTFSIRLDGKVSKVTSAYRGALPYTMKEGCLMVTIPSLGYGDLLRIDSK